jgi:CubicO group peptidase (beta-lactamase class C family)
MKKFLLFLPLMFALTCVSLAQSKVIKELDAVYAKSIAEWNVPGMAVAIVQDGKTVFEKGYGVRSSVSNEKVNEHSIFAVASNSKAFTAAALAILVDDGKLQWNDKVRDYLPWFELYDPYVSSEMTIRDLLCHRSGLATFSGDLLWYGSNHSAEEVVQKAKGLEPAFSFRGGYGYQNVMFIAAGLIIEKVSGTSWSDFVSQRILQPIGMKETLTSVTQFTPTTNKAEPHNTKNGENYPIEWVNWDNVVAAGGIITSVHDFAKWLNLQVSKGKIGETTVFTEARWNEMTEIQNPRPVSNWSRKMMPDKIVGGYALGWEVMVYKGVKVVMHGGGYDGMISQSFFVPEKGFGGVIVTNNITNVSYALMLETLDRLIDGKSTDFPAKLLEVVKEGEEKDKQDLKAFEDARALNTTPSLPLSAYAGEYRDEYYGDCIVVVDGEKLAFNFDPTPLFKGTLEHWHYDTFRLHWGSKMMLPSGTAQFVLDANGKVTELKIDVPNPDFDFTELKFIRTE